MRERETPSDFVKMETELLRYKAKLVDPETRLPTLALILDQARELLSEAETVQVFVIRIEQEQLLEGVIGWEMYDQYMCSAAAYLQDIVASDGILCLENVRSDVFVILSTSPDLSHRVEDRLAQGLPVNSSSTPTVFPVRIGQGRVWRSPAIRLERCLYNGILEARRDFHRRGQMLDESRRTDLRQILKDRNITTLYQPIFSLPEHRAVAFEALSRGPAGSYFETPENLFGFTERIGMLGEVEQLCVEQALHNAHKLPGPTTLFINLSIYGLEFIETAGRSLLHMVESVNCAPRDLVLEITERTYSDNPTLLRQRVESLRKHGFRIAIDDMGTGFSSLNILTELEPEYIKLDQTLVRQLTNRPIKQNLVAAIAGFASKSNSQIIAEGVENENDSKTCAKLGIHLVQGFYFAKPRPAEEFQKV